MKVSAIVLTLAAALTSVAAQKSPISDLVSSTDQIVKEFGTKFDKVASTVPDLSAAEMKELKYTLGLLTEHVTSQVEAGKPAAEQFLEALNKLTTSHPDTAVGKSLEELQTALQSVGERFAKLMAALESPDTIGKIVGESRGYVTSLVEKFVRFTKDLETFANILPTDAATSLGDATAVIAEVVVYIISPLAQVLSW